MLPISVRPSPGCRHPVFPAFLLASTRLGAPGTQRGRWVILARGGFSDQGEVVEKFRRMLLTVMS